MRPIDIVKQAAGMKFTDEDGNVTEIKLLPPLTTKEMHEFESKLPCSLPTEVRELLSYCRGFDGVLESINSSGLEQGFRMEEIFPCPISIAHDGYGNYWIVDLTSESTSWGPIFFACHDAPVIVFQTDSLAHFISEIIRFGNPPWESEIDDVHEEYHRRIWKENPNLMTYEQCIKSGDKDLIEFA